ncbi:MAG: aminotransferase class I/II-fold pyridoxal phosphate-dependent enzyme, partial [Clostridiales bacterium]|nr:aminotransferase class I/II-fold pyridoxal phosphate-dependent enzyme [Clostridiales bacterium]
MPLQVSNLCKNITPSATLRLNALANEKRRQGQDVISLAAGEPDFQTPFHIRQAGKEAIEQGKTVYTATAGIPDLRQAIAKKYRDKGVDYQNNQVIVGTGAKQVLMEALCALLESGDEVLLPTPCWLSYPEMIAMAGAKAIPVHTSLAQGYVPSRESLESAVTKRTRAIIINNPSNPTGMVWNKAVLEMVTKLAQQYDFAIISDEIYETFCYDGCQSTIVAGLSSDAFERTITVSGFS